MNLVTEIFVAIITSYLAFTNGLALQIEQFLSEPADTEFAEEQTKDQSSGFSFLPSRLSGAIPDILLRSAEYQEAALGSAAGLTGATAQAPIDAIVNIFCTFTTPEYIRTTTGTGFFIDPDGVIMTNAHVAQFLLLEDAQQNGKTDCIVRTGNPASPQYRAELLYLPPAWVQDNAAVMNDPLPMGTGERDYALLFISSNLNGSPLPAIFPALSFDTSLLPISTKNTLVTAAGYPAGDLLRNGPNTDLIPRSAQTTVSELYTFGSNYADVFSIRGSEVGAEGASGGPVVNQNGEVIGMIVTRGDDSVDGPGSLRAITLSHISRTIEEETGFSFEENLHGDLSYRAQVFSQTLTPFLVSILANAQ